jgi:hypothetical protein
MRTKESAYKVPNFREKFALKMEAACTSETLVHGVTTQTTST